MKKLIIICWALILSMVTSCSDSFLEVSPKAALSNTTLQNNKGVNALLVGAYALLDGWATPEGAYRSYQVGADNWVYGSVASDDAYKGTIAGDQPPISLIEQGNISSDNIYFRGKWRGMYDGIARCNCASFSCDHWFHCRTRSTWRRIGRNHSEWCPDGYFPIQRWWCLG